MVYGLWCIMLMILMVHDLWLKGWGLGSRMQNRKRKDHLLPERDVRPEVHPQRFPNLLRCLGFRLFWYSGLRLFWCLGFRLVWCLRVRVSSFGVLIQGYRLWFVGVWFRVLVEGLTNLQGGVWFSGFGVDIVPEGFLRRACRLAREAGRCCPRDAQV